MAGDVLRDIFFLGVMFVEPSGEPADDAGEDAAEDADDVDFREVFVGVACCSDWHSDPFFERFLGLYL